MLRSLYRFADLLREQSRQHTSNPDQALGRRGEDLAHRFLQGAGMAVVARNYRMASGAGEVDLIGWERDTLVFVEVKSRQTDDY
ncbi:MAG TPA: YraN family protein, partial [Bryobacteraceae bacterium]|nr:YraN family protein [Bryobacteraceae bacterium]